MDDNYGYWMLGYPATCSNCGGEAPVIIDNDLKYIYETPEICPHCKCKMIRRHYAWKEG